MYGESPEPSLAEIHQEMSELLDKQVNAQTKKNFQGSRKLLQAHEKVCDEMKQTNKKKRHTCKNVIHGRKPFITPNKKLVKTICTSCWEMIVDIMKVLF